MAVLLTSYMLIFNLFMRKEGYDDAVIADMNMWPYLAVLIFSLPVGLLIKGLRLKPFLIAAAIFMPVGGWFIPDLIAADSLTGARFAYMALGLGWMLAEVCGLPFILRNGDKAIESEGIALNYATFPFGMILSGLGVFLLTKWGTFNGFGLAFEWTEYSMLKAFSVLQVPALLLMLFLREKAPEVKSAEPAWKLLRRMREYDWKAIGQAIFPTSIIALGAGLTIPFINLFFNSVFNIDSHIFGLIGMGTSILVLFTTLIVPLVNRKFGYKIAITASQLLSVLMLILLAFTEIFSHWTGMLYLAVACYMLRTPFMNMARPMTSELTMNYVGEANQELMSALVSSVWSGSWVISSKIFQVLRNWDLAYYQIFFITAGFYLFGIYKYYQLILRYRKLRGDERKKYA